MLVWMHFFVFFCHRATRYALSSESRDLFKRVRGHAPPENLERMVQSNFNVNIYLKILI